MRCSPFSTPTTTSTGVVGDENFFNGPPSSSVNIYEKKHVCSWCSKRFYTAPELKRHVRVHTGEKPYSCGVCARQFSVQSNLKRHLKVHVSSRPFNCKFCARGFATEAKLQYHEIMHSLKL